MSQGLLQSKDKFGGSALTDNLTAILDWLKFPLFYGFDRCVVEYGVRFRLFNLDVRRVAAGHYGEVDFDPTG